MFTLALTCLQEDVLDLRGSVQMEAARESELDSRVARLEQDLQLSQLDLDVTK